MIFKKKLIIPLFIIFLDIFSFSFLLPSIPHIVEEFGFNSFYVGLTVSLTAIGVLIGGVLFGKLSDIFGRKKILLFTIILNFFGYFLFLFSSHLYIFILARFLNGLGGGGISILQGHISDISEPKKLLENMGYISAIYGLGFISGPAIGFFFSGFELFQTGIFLSILLFLSFIICLIFFPNSKKQTNIKVSNTGFLMKKNLGYFLMSFFIIFTLVGIQTIFPLYLGKIYNFGMDKIYLFFATMGILSVLYQLLIFNKIKKYFSEKRILSSGVVFFIAFLLILIFNTSSELLFILSIFPAIGILNVNNVLFTILSRKNDSSSIGSTFGLNTGFSSFGEIFGSLIAGFFYLISYKITFLFFAVFLFLYSVYFLFFVYKE